MHNGEMRFRWKGVSLPAGAQPVDWLQNIALVIVLGKVLPRRMVAKIFDNSDGKLYLHVEVDQDRVSAPLTLPPGVYFDIPTATCLRHFSSASFKPGIHCISNLIRLCRYRQLHGQNERAWAGRRKVLKAIADLSCRLDNGIYEITVGKSVPADTAAGGSLTAPLRGSEFVGGSISAGQRQKLQRHLNTWTARTRRTEPVAPRQLIGAVNDLYTSFGLAAPRVVIAPSPLVAAIAASFAAAFWQAKKDQNACDESSQEAFESFVSREVYEATVGRAFYSVEDSIDCKTLQMFEGLLNETGGAESSRSLHGAAGAAIESALEDASEATIVSVTRGQPKHFERSIDAAVFQATRLATGTDQEGFMAAPTNDYKGVGTMFEQLARELSLGQDNVKDLMLSCLSDCRRFLQMSNSQKYDECLTMGLQEVLDLNLAAKENYCAWQNVATRCGPMILHEKFCIVSDFPEELNTDEQGRPHSESGPSYVWPDGWTLYHWHGIRVTRQIIEKMESITVADIKQEPNLEVRRVMLDRYGIKRFLIDSDAREIHRDECGVLYSQMIHPALEPIVMVKVVNSTAEPDGTYKDYFLRVPPHLRTAKAAVAWTFGVERDQYQPLVQT